MAEGDAHGVDPWTYHTPEIVAGRGIYVYDADGRAYIDGASGTFNVSLGHSHPEVVEAIQVQADKLIHGTTAFRIEAVEALRRELVAVSPANLKHVQVKVSGGSTANEGAIKMAQLTTGRRDVVTLFRAHHGQTAMTTALSGNSFRRADFPTFPVDVVHVPDPYCYRCFYRQRPETCGLLCVDRIADFLEHASSGQPACVLVEPISGNGGNIVPPPGYLDALRKFCDERDMLLIFDEVQTGIGRTGRMFAADYFDVQPDILTFGKGLGGSGAQVAGILSTADVRLLETYQHSFTYGGNVLAAVAGLKTLEIIVRPGFLEHVRSVGERILSRLRELQARFPFVGDVRGVGLMIGVEVIDADGRRSVPLTSRLSARAHEVGLLLRTSQFGRGNVLKIRPPLIISDEEADEMCDRIERLFELMPS